MDIEKVAEEDPEKIITTKVKPGKDIQKKDIENIIKPFNLNGSQKQIANKLIQALFDIIQQKDASLIEINPLIIYKKRINLFRCKNEF